MWKKSKHSSENVLSSPPNTPPSTTRSLLPDVDREPKLYAELYRIARRLRESGAQSVGLLPATSKVAVSPVAIKLGAVLVDACDGAVAVVDANNHHPGFEHLADKNANVSGKAGFAPTWLADFLVLLSPRDIREPGLAIDALDRLLLDESEGYTHVLVDLTGFELVGELGAAFESVDTVVLVSFPGAATEREILRLHRSIPANKRLGMLLVG